MSSHPNAILQLNYKPAIGTDAEALTCEIGTDPYEGDIRSIMINSVAYNVLLMGEEEYDEGFQVSGECGDIVLFDLVTYDYGDKISWDNLVARRTALAIWADTFIEKHGGSYKIYISANYW